MRFFLRSFLVERAAHGCFDRWWIGNPIFELSWGTQRAGFCLSVVAEKHSLFAASTFICIAERLFFQVSWCKATSPLGFARC